VDHPFFGRRVCDPQIPPRYDSKNPEATDQATQDGVAVDTRSEPVASKGVVRPQGGGPCLFINKQKTLDRTSKTTLNNPSAETT
jgi:hypothetical protein